MGGGGGGVEMMRPPLLYLHFMTSLFKVNCLLKSL